MKAPDHSDTAGVIKYIPPRMSPGTRRQLALVALSCLAPFVCGALALSACGSALEGEPPGRHEVEPSDGDGIDGDDADAADTIDDTSEVADGDVTPDTTPVEVDADTTTDMIEETADDVAVDSADTTPPGPCDGLDEGAPCDDGDLCTLGDRCTEVGLPAGVSGRRCLPTDPVECDDGNVCTDDTCLPAVGCLNVANLAACEDDNPCTTGDRCSAGRCRPGGDRCDDRNPCTRDACAPDGTCTNTADDSLPCEDGSACTSGDFCADGVCMHGPGDGCAEDDPCVAVACGADGLTCELELLEGVGCDDGDACTQDDTCVSGLCRGGLATKCPWDSECAVYRCDRQDGCLLETTFPSGKACSDDDRCTEGETCDGAGVCAPIAPAACDDDNVCTEDSCDATWGCEHAWVNGPCDDGSRCTLADACQFGQCRGTTVDCQDGDLCTLDSCDGLLGCQHLPTPCDDGNPCTIDSCERSRGCEHTARTGACDDGLACTVLDACDAGVCKGGAVTCDDADPCTVDVCDLEEGCVNVPLDPCPIGALSIVAVGTNGRADGVGQWVAVNNGGAVTFDLEGYAIRGEACDCEVAIDEEVLVVAGATVYGLRASVPAPAAADIAPGGPTSASAFDFEVGVPGDGFRIGVGDRLELVAPGGAVVDSIDVP